MPSCKDIIYPFFLECCQYATDVFWKNIFEDLAYGKSSYGTYISKHFLCCSFKGKEFVYKIEKKDPFQLYTDVYNLLTKKLGILSTKDKTLKRIEFYKIEQDIHTTCQSWLNIKKKNLKDLIIEQFVVYLKQKHSLNLKQAKYLMSIIFIAMVFKVITSKDIVYENGMITNIECLSYENGTIILKRKLYNISLDISPETVENSKLMSDNWAKYLESIKRKI